MKPRTALHPLLRIAFLIVSLFWAGVGEAQEVEAVTDLDVAFVFGEQVAITGKVRVDLEIESVDIQLAFPGDPRIMSETIFPAVDGTFTFVHLVSDRFIQAFSTVEYQFVLTTSDGQIISSDLQTFFYTDNRFDWFSLESGPFNVHWYEGDTAYARSILDAALDGMNRSRSLLGASAPERVDIYAYASLADYQFLRGQLGQLWAGGHADPSAGLVLVSLPPGPEVQIEVERKIPHEIAHIVLFESTGAGFWNLPVWLNEGFASTMETFPNADYGFLVLEATGSGTNVPLSDLCDVFPGDASGALLAYAESASVVGYIVDHYGPEGVRAVVEAYASGAGCTLGTQVQPVALNLADLDVAWQEQLRSGSQAPTPVDTDLSELAPLIAVFTAVILGPGLVLIGSRLRRNGPRGR